MNPKIQWLRNTMSSLNLQGLIISNPVNIKYLTNVDAEGTLLLTRKDNIYKTRNDRKANSRRNRQLL